MVPRLVCETLRRALLQSFEFGKEAVEKALDRAQMAAALPWRTLDPVRFDPARLKQVLDRTHGGLDRVKTRLVDVLAASPQTRGALTVEAPRRGKGVETESSAARRAPTHASGRGAHPVPVRAPGDRQDVHWPWPSPTHSAVPRLRVTLLDKGNTERLIHGQEGDAPGRILQGLREAGVRNPVFILEAIDRVEPEAADELLDILDPGRCIVFEDHYLQVRFDLPAVLWIATATDPAAIPEAVRNRLEVIELPGVHRAREAGHRRTVPAEAPVRWERARAGVCGSRRRPTSLRRAHPVNRLSVPPTRGSVTPGCLREAQARAGRVRAPGCGGPAPGFPAFALCWR